VFGAGFHGRAQVGAVSDLRRRYVLEHARPGKTFEIMNAKAIVTMTVQVHLSQPWGPDCMISQIHKQAASEARDKLISAIQSKPGMVLCGEPKVTAVIVENES
jgi:hypothetical protein